MSVQTAIAIANILGFGDCFSLAGELELEGIRVGFVVVLCWLLQELFHRTRSCLFSPCSHPWVSKQLYSFDGRRHLFVRFREVNAANPHLAVMDAAATTTSTAADAAASGTPYMSEVWRAALQALLDASTRASSRDCEDETVDAANSLAELLALVLSAKP